MSQKIQKTYIMLGLTVLILASLACGSVQVGVVTPTAEDVVQPVSGEQESKSESAALEAVETQTEDEIIVEPDQLITEQSTTVTAWLGHIASLPQSSQ